MYDKNILFIKNKISLVIHFRQKFLYLKKNQFIKKYTWYINSNKNILYNLADFTAFDKNLFFYFFYIFIYLNKKNICILNFK